MLLLEYQRTDTESGSCLWSICADGQVARRGEDCPDESGATRRLTRSQVTELWHLVDPANFFLLEDSYLPQDSC